MSLQAHSLVANVLPFIIISKVVTIKDSSRLNQDSKTSEHHMPGVAVQSSAPYELHSARDTMHVLV